jgi:hypothetical protein
VRFVVRGLPVGEMSYLKPRLRARLPSPTRRLSWIDEFQVALLSIVRI